MTLLHSQFDQRTYLISSYNHLEQVQADRKTAINLIDIFCTVTATKDYDTSSLVKIENYQINYDLLIKLLKRTISDEITLTSEQQQILQPLALKLQQLNH